MALLTFSDITKNYKRLVGIDEVGRGCWAGPVAVGAYVYSDDHVPLEDVKDSKLVPPTIREQLFSNLSNQEHSVHFATVESINEMGVGKSIEQLIRVIVEKYTDDNTFFLIDGRFATKFGKNTIQIIKGDNKYYPIAAASILAKVSRDRLMSDYALEYEKWGFETHKGYGTKKHREAISQHGICNLHRKSFKPIMQLL